MRCGEAIAFAARHHAEQFDKAGVPYFFHPMRVADRARRNGASPEGIVAAVLHDVVEDCGVSLEEIRERFGDTVARIVDALTRRDMEKEYAEFIDRVAGDCTDAIIVKLADIADNLGRLHDGVEGSEKLRARYEPAQARLREELRRRGRSVED